MASLSQYKGNRRWRNPHVRLRMIALLRSAQHSEHIPVGIYAMPSLTAASNNDLEDQAEAAAQQAAAQPALALPQVILGQQPGKVLARSDLVKKHCRL